MKFKGVKDIVTTAQKRFTAVNRAREKVSVKKKILMTSLITSHQVKHIP